ncbi:MAG: hypothetical protein V1781_07345 [Bacteroidota bacterium]
MIIPCGLQQGCSLWAVLKISFVIATARHEAGSNLYFYMKKQIASVVPPSQ